MTTILWDMDGVMIPGRGTTHLARGYKNGDPQYFIGRFLEECGKDGPLRNVGRAPLETGFAEWEKSYNDGHRIRSIYELATCLTDLRHKLKVFPGSEQTIYTKNTILEGLSMARIAEIAEELPYNDDVENTVRGFAQSGFRQVLFSNSNRALVDAVAKKFEFVYNTGAQPKVIISNSDVKDYDPRFYGRSDVKLAGSMNEWDKPAHVLRYLYSSDKDEIAAIDDTEIEMLVALRSHGAKVFGFYNESDRDMKTDDLRSMEKNNISVLRKIADFQKAVLKK